MSKEIIQLAEVAKMLGIDHETARRWAIAGKLPVFRYHNTGRWRAFREDIDKYLSSLQPSNTTGQSVSAAQ